MEVRKRLECEPSDVEGLIGRSTQLAANSATPKRDVQELSLITIGIGDWLTSLHAR
jgi:hypothetical protein